MPKHVTTVTMAEARARLPELVRRVEAGEQVVIVRNRRPVARLDPLTATAPRRPGTARGRVLMAADFEAPVPGFDG